MLIDLHLHSRASDGTFTPEEVASLAADAGMYAIALTDHDTVDGVPPCRERCKALGLKFVPGVEISTGGDRETHLLGYGVREEPMALGLAAMRDDRMERMERMVRRLQEEGMGVTMEDVREVAGGAPLGRPHAAMALVRAGYASSVKNAFDRWLGDGRPCCVRRRRMSLETAVKLIHEAGGVAVIAHPVLIKCERRMLTQTLAEMAAAGVDGVEAWHSAHTLSDARELDAFARRHGLLVTGGSDFHGGAKNVGIGQGLRGWTGMDTDFSSLVQAIDAHREAPLWEHEN